MRRRRPPRRAPPQKKAKALPCPDEKHKKKRGGKRARAIKEKCAQSEMLKLANRVQFGVQEAEVFGGFARDTATISIGRGATIDGGTVQIDAFAGNQKASFSNDPLTALASRMPTAVLTAINDIAALPLTVSVKRPTATIDVGENARVAARCHSSA